ncbi:glutamyl-tRNA reductase [Bacillus solimangrovi]|uniref:Glutamyl-tRNA reductase n=1 Tax=Bacillus solimangrovi TaxID=1305675 RepID=A0A1E5LBH3_9BACI|nr:glutamyl-tRNA reductase [Bacillus solimangrovi]OEH91434.1 glutamyl-tRNA reductase [Bacillus solimangrovi]
MHILAVGFNYKTAPVEIREKLTFNEANLSEAHKTLRKQKSILENVIISTCNRTELYVVADQLHTGRYYTKAFLAEWFGLEIDEFAPFLKIYENEHAIEHLFRVACGLDSMVLGETQILGQVRDSFLLAQQEKTTGTLFNQLFKQAVTLAKRSHFETEIGGNAVSVSYAAVELSKQIFGSLNDKHVVIVGAGKMGELAAKNLQGSGASKITVINRTIEKAVELANRFSGQAASLDNLEKSLIEGDILISSTGKNGYVVTKDMMKKVEKQRKGRPLFMVDIAVPRDLDPELDKLESVFLYDIDDLEGIVEANIEERKKAAEQVGVMIEAEIIAYQQWIDTLGVVPIISSLRKRALAVQAETLDSIERKIPNLTEREKKVLNKHTKSIINQLLREPVTRAKEIAAQEDAEDSLKLFMKIFDLEEDVQAEIELQKSLNKVVIPIEKEKRWTLTYQTSKQS